MLRGQGVCARGDQGASPPAAPDPAPAEPSCRCRAWLDSFPRCPGGISAAGLDNGSVRWAAPYFLCTQFSRGLFRRMLALACTGKGSSEGDGDGGPSEVAPAVIPPVASTRFGAAGALGWLLTERSSSSLERASAPGSPGCCLSAPARGAPEGRTCPLYRSPPSGNLPSAFGIQRQGSPCVNKGSGKLAEGMP